MYNAGMSESFEVGGFIVEVLLVGYFPSFTKESEEYPSRVASQKQEVGGDFCQLIFIPLTHQ